MRTGDPTSPTASSPLARIVWWWSGTRTGSGTTCPATTIWPSPARRVQVSTEDEDETLRFLVLLTHSDSACNAALLHLLSLLVFLVEWYILRKFEFLLFFRGACLLLTKSHFIVCLQCPVASLQPCWMHTPLGACARATRSTPWWGTSATMASSRGTCQPFGAEAMGGGISPGSPAWPVSPLPRPDSYLNSSGPFVHRHTWWTLVPSYQCFLWSDTSDTSFSAVRSGLLHYCSHKWSLYCPFYFKCLGLGFSVQFYPKRHAILKYYILQDNDKNQVPCYCTVCKSQLY